MKQYLEILQEVLDKGTYKSPERENMPATISRFGIEKRFDLQEGFPLVTTKKMFLKGVIHELLWFLRGDTNIKYLLDNGVNIWNEDGYKWYLKRMDHYIDKSHKYTFEEWKEACIQGKYFPNDLGKIYSHQWRDFNGDTYDARGEGVDQIQKVIINIKKNPESRYHVVTAWNPSEINSACLPPCHMLFQFNCRKMTSYQREDYDAKIHNFTEEQRGEMNPNASDDDVNNAYDQINFPKYYLDCKMTQRSCDTPLGVPFNIASYALLTMIIAKLTNTIPGEFIWSGNDVHIYENQIETVKEQLKRKPLQLPTMKITGEWKSIDDIKYEDFELVDYQYHPKLTYPLSTGLKK